MPTSGSAIFNDTSNTSAGRLNFVNSTFSGNSAGGGDGGAIYNSWADTLTVTNCTFWNNGAYTISTHGLDSVVTVTNTIITNDNVAFSGSNCSERIADGGHNLESGTSCRFSSANGSFSNTNPLLAPAGAANNGDRHRP